MTQVLNSYSDHELLDNSIKPVCVKCSKNFGAIIRMEVKRNGVSIPYGPDSAQMGDLFVCPVCHNEIIQGLSKVLSKSLSKQVLNTDYAILKEVNDNLI